jgi:hypothetical protein
MINNEKLFSFRFRRRDDQELFAGDFMSKVLVPHPALNFPKNLTLTYQVYRGWLTRGLSSWSISKIILSDSFGESYSLCKQFKLESGKPQRMTLLPGDCHEEELSLLAEKFAKEAETSTNTSVTTISPQSSTESYPAMFNITEVMSLGKHIPLERNETESVESITEKVSNTSFSSSSWKPMIASNNATNSKEISDEELLTGEKMPPKVMNKKNEKRSFGGGSNEDDLLNSVPIRDDSSDMDEPVEDVITDEKLEDKFVTVQLFQYRLGDVFEKAERYARFTLFPLLSEQISNIFNFETTEKDATSTDSPIVIKSKSKKLRKFDIEEEIDMRSLQSMGLRSNEQPHIKPIEKIFNNYDAKSIEKENQKKSEADEENIKINLPTYRPPGKEKLFIPIERTP